MLDGRGGGRKARDKGMGLLWGACMGLLACSNPVPDEGVLSAQIVARAIPPGGQEHVCVVVELANEEPIWVDRIRGHLSGGSHHLIVDRADPSTELISEPTPCTPTQGGDSSRLIIAQQEEAEVKLPDGVAYRLEAHQRIFLQLHYFNAFEDTRDIRGTVELSPVDPNAPAPREAKTSFYGTVSISIPAHGTGDAMTFYNPPVTGDGSAIRLFAITSHTHRLGVRATIERVPHEQAPATTPLHVSTNWSEPPLTLLDPPLTFVGDDGLRLACQYRNDTDDGVTFGVLAASEMCNLWTYYYEE